MLQTNVRTRNGFKSMQLQSTILNTHSFCQFRHDPLFDLRCQDCLPHFAIICAHKKKECMLAQLMRNKQKSPFRFRVHEADLICPEFGFSKQFSSLRGKIFGRRFSTRKMLTAQKRNQEQAFSTETSRCSCWMNPSRPTTLLHSQ